MTLRKPITVMIFAGAFAVGAAIDGRLSSQAPPQAGPADWTSYGGDSAHTHYSPLSEITPQNVAGLRNVWTYRLNPQPPTPPPPPTAVGAPPAGGRGAGGRAGRGAGGAGGGGGGGGRGSQVTPLVVGGLMFLTTPYSRVVALDPSTGKEVWVHEGGGSPRGVAYWPGDGQHGPAIIFHGSGGLVSLDARTGKPNVGFGRNGVVAPDSGGTNGTSPPAIYKNVIISGTANPNRDGRPEDVRGFDAISGKQLWRFATIPEQGQPGRDTWSPGVVEDRRYSSGTSVGVWGLMSVDAERGIVYVPLDSPQWERWGGDRIGDNLYGDSLVAIDASTGKYLWHFQVTRHDLWDLDLAGAPVLFDVKRNGGSTPAVGVMGKSGILFILDRVTGKPIYEVVEKPVEQSTVPGEKTSPTQPFPAKLLPIARLSVSESEIATVTPELFEACTKLVKENNIKLGGPYNPPGFNRPTVNFPGANGASNWGGMSYNPGLGYLIMNTQDLGQITSLGPKGDPIRTNGTSGVRAGDSPTVPYDMTGLNGRFAIVTPGQPMLMCQEPPWGSLTAVNVNTWEIAWKVPLGITESLPPGKQNTGRPNLGSTATTASGLVFVGATDDSRFRAFDARSGKVLWEVTLPAPGRGGPTIFQGRDGKQHVAIVATDLMVYGLP